MVNRPSLQELLQAVQGFLEKEIAPIARNDSVLNYRTLIAVNLLKIVEREVELGTATMRAEWDRLNGLEGVDIPAPTPLEELRSGLSQRNQLLAESIRDGGYDEPAPRALLLAHLVATAREQLAIANPRFLLTDAPVNSDA